MKDALLMIFIKNPVLGSVKTRLAQTVGNEKALAVYKELLSHTLSISGRLACDKAVFYSDHVEEDEWKAAGFRQLVQQGADLGQRMQNAFAEGFGLGYKHVIIIGSDCAELDEGILKDALDLLETHDAVLGPAHDGGYYLLGLNALHPQLFKDKPWSTDAVLSLTLESLREAGLAYGLLPTLHDIDTENDLIYFIKPGKTMLNQIEETRRFLETRGINNIDAGVVLGTGMSRFIEQVNVTHTIPYSDIPNFPVATVEFHKGHLVFGTIGAKRVLVMNGRFHYYEGYSMQQVTFPIRIMKALGAKHLFLSNVSGGINKALGKGSLVCISDHINLQTSSPLIGKNHEELGPRFPDMSEPYSATLTQLLMGISAEKNVSLKSGVYAAVNGPQLETRAEYRFLRTIGADMVGMSTVPEVIVARHMDLPCVAISVITDECDPDNLASVSIPEIIEIAGKADPVVSGIFSEAIRRLD